MLAAEGPYPEEYVELTAGERLAALCSAYEVRSEQLLRCYVELLSADDWSVTTRLLAAHGLATHLWFHLQRLVDELPNDIANEAMFTWRGAATHDDDQVQAMVELSSELSRAGVHFANMKGVFLRRWLYDASAPPRASSDLDILVFGGREPMARAMRVLADLGYAETSPQGWESRWRKVADYSVARTVSSVRFYVEPHRSPATIFLEGRQSEALLRWLEGGARLLGTPPVPSLSPEGHLVLLAIKLFSDAMPTLRIINDLAMLATRHGASLDWDEIGRIAKRCHLGEVIGTALGLARRWRGIPRFAGEPHARPHAALLPYLEVPAILRGPTVGPFGDSRQPAHLAFLLAFGWRTGVRGWLALERINRPYVRESLGVEGSSIAGDMSYMLHMARSLREPLRRLLVDRRGWDD